MPPLFRKAGFLPMPLRGHRRCREPTRPPLPTPRHQCQYPDFTHTLHIFYTPLRASILLGSNACWEWAGWRRRIKSFRSRLPIGGATKLTHHRCHQPAFRHRIVAQVRAFPFLWYAHSHGRTIRFARFRCRDAPCRRVGSPSVSPLCPPPPFN